MQIDWFTLIAQVINFLVLVWLLKHFLFGRIVDAMTARESKIASRLADAAEQRAEAEREAQGYRDRIQDLDTHREHAWAKAEEEARAYRQQAIEEAREEVEQEKGRWYEVVRKEQVRFVQDFREQLGRLTFTLVRRTLKDLAHVELEQRMVHSFLERMTNLEASERAVMAEAIRNSDGEVQVQSAFALGTKLRERLSAEIRKQLAPEVVVHFTVEPALGCGIELYAHSHRLAWNQESYLESLEGAFFRDLEAKARAHATTRAESSPSDRAGATASASA